MGHRSNLKQALFEMFGVGKAPSFPAPVEETISEKTFERADNQQSDHLKPCPFCGGKAETWRVLDTNMYMVGCVDDQNCIGNIKQVARVFLTDKSAVATWNRRAKD